MALAEDPASVLEQFLHDVANLPAEITHLYEEMQAKDQQIRQERCIIAQKDYSLQKFIKHNGSLIKNPKEDAYAAAILKACDRAQALQEDRIALAEKAVALLDRHVKRLDIKVRDLQNDGSMPKDPDMPSVLRDTPANLVPPASSINSGATTPLHPLSINTAGGSVNIANAAIARLQSAAGNGRLGVNAMQAHPLLNQSHLATPAAVAAMRSQREMSVGSDTKRRRMNASLGALPTPSSSLARPSSMGPGTPKPMTPGSRAGSAGPRPPKKAQTKKVIAPPQPPMKKKVGKGGIPKKSQRRLLGNNKASPSTTGDDDSVLSENDMSEDEHMSGAGNDGTQDDDTMDADDEDRKYCICHSSSYGDMVACDNEDCPYEWFHWECVKITSEPEGDWLCPDCRKLPSSKIRKSK